MKAHLLPPTLASVLALVSSFANATPAGLPSQWAGSFAENPSSVQVLTAAEQETYQGAAGPVVLARIGGIAGAATYVGSTLVNGNTPTVSGTLLAAAGGAVAGMAPGLGLGAAGTAVVQGGVGIGTAAAVSVTDRGPSGPPPKFPYQMFGIGGGCDPIRCIYKDGVLRPRLPNENR